MPALDAKQKELAKKILEFRDRIIQDQEKKERDRQLEKFYLAFSGTLRTLREVALKLRKYDAPLFQDVLLAIRSLQGDMDNDSTLK